MRCESLSRGYALWNLAIWPRMITRIIGKERVRNRKKARQVGKTHCRHSTAKISDTEQHSHTKSGKIRSYVCEVCLSLSRPMLGSVGTWDHGCLHASYVNGLEIMNQFFDYFQTFSWMPTCTAVMRRTTFRFDTSTDDSPTQVSADESQPLTPNTIHLPSTLHVGEGIIGSSNQSHVDRHHDSEIRVIFSYPNESPEEIVR